MMPKQETITAIRKLNRTADPGFLAEFSGDDLSDYLDRLTNRPPPRPLVEEAMMIDEADLDAQSRRA